MPTPRTCSGRFTLRRARVDGFRSATEARVWALSSPHEHLESTSFTPPTRPTKPPTHQPAPHLRTTRTQPSLNLPHPYTCRCATDTPVLALPPRSWMARRSRCCATRARSPRGHRSTTNSTPRRATLCARAAARRYGVTPLPISPYTHRTPLLSLHLLLTPYTFTLQHATPSTLLFKLSCDWSLSSYPKFPT